VHVPAPPSAGSPVVRTDTTNHERVRTSGRTCPLPRWPGRRTPGGLRPLPPPGGAVWAGHGRTLRGPRSGQQRLNRSGNSREGADYAGYRGQLSTARCPHPSGKCLPSAGNKQQLQLLVAPMEVLQTATAVLESVDRTLDGHPFSAEDYSQLVRRFVSAARNDLGVAPLPERAS
jgi:hypothetical protein